mgnify:CR=1 FL=1
MARTVAAVPPGPRLTDCISLGVLAKAFPRARIDQVLAATGKGSVRQRDLPAHVVSEHHVSHGTGSAPPAEELAALYHERGEIETALDELKTHWRGHRWSCGARRPTWCARSAAASCWRTTPFAASCTRPP